MTRLEVSLEVIVDDFQKIGFADEDEAVEVIRLTLERELEENITVGVKDYYLVEDDIDYGDYV